MADTTTIADANARRAEGGSMVEESRQDPGGEWDTPLNIGGHAIVSV